MNIFNPEFWGGNYWSAIGAIFSLLGALLSPLLAIVYDRIFGKKDHQEHINAYKALLLPDRPLSAGEAFRFIFVQGAASYCLYIVARRLFLINPADPNTLLVISFAFVFIVTWGLSVARHKSLARLLAWQFCLAFALFVAIFLSQKGNSLITANLTWIKHALGQYLPENVKQFPVISSLRTLDLRAVPVDLHPESLSTVRNSFLIVYGLTLAFFLFCYTIYKRHHARQVSAFVLLNEKQRKDEMELLDYQLKQKDLEIKDLEKQEKEAELKQIDQKAALALGSQQLALERQQLEVASARLDVERKRVQYSLELATQLIDMLYDGSGDPAVRAELLRHMLPAFKEFGHPEQESTTLILNHLQQLQPPPTWPDFAGSGGGTANPEFVRLLSEGDRGDSQFSPRTTMNTFYLKPTFKPPPDREEMYLTALLTTKVTPGNYPGDTTSSNNWPTLAPGTHGVNNALSPKYMNQANFATISNKPAVLWFHGADDQVVSDTSFFDFGYLGQLGFVPGWPGAEDYPPQPMKSQVRFVLDSYKGNGGEYEEAELADCGHSPHIEKFDAVVELVDSFMRKHGGK